jgi:hypothetical protein
MPSPRGKMAVPASPATAEIITRIVDGIEIDPSHR